MGESVFRTLEETGLLRLHVGRMEDDKHERISSGERPAWFGGADRITAVQIHDGATGIGRQGFYGLANPVHASIPQSIADIGADAFESCASLVGIGIPDSAITIGKTAFCGRHVLSEVSFPFDGKCEVIPYLS